MSNDRPTHCPRCGSPHPNMHPAVQSGGEVTVCPDPWHGEIVTTDPDTARDHEAWMLEKSPDWAGPIVGHVVDPNLPAAHDPDRANLRLVLEEQELLGLRRELLDLIADNFHAEGNRLICNRCDTVVTWVTKHLAERHGMDVQVWILPEHLECEQLW